MGVAALIAPESAIAGKPWNLGRPTARTLASDLTRDRWREWPGSFDHGDFGISECTKLRRNKVVCQAWITGRQTKEPRDELYWDYRCEFAWVFRTSSVPIYNMTVTPTDSACKYDGPYVDPTWSG